MLKHQRLVCAVRNGVILFLSGTAPSNTAVIVVFDDSNHKQEAPKMT